MQKQGSGKSHVLKLTGRCMIPKTWVTSSKNTKNALTTNVNYDGMVVIMDELPDEFFTPDGDTQLKEVISTGELTCRMNQVIDAKRVEILTKSKHSSCYLLASNRVGLSKPMRDRIPIHSVSDFNPKPKRSAAQSILAQLGRDTNEEIKADGERFEESLRVMQMLICFAYLFIACGLLHPPDLSVAIMYFVANQCKLTQQGI
jgi:hypothetical protein